MTIVYEARGGRAGVPLIDGIDKVTGRALYTADLDRTGALAGAILRSPVAHAEILAIDVSKALYQSAQVDYYEVLMTVRDSLEAEMDLVEAKKSQLQAVVAIYQALGGGWRASGAREPPPGRG